MEKSTYNRKKKVLNIFMKKKCLCSSYTLECAKYNCSTFSPNSAILPGENVIYLLE